jgi:uncharacterized protein YndB with AHSA1/START domain
MTETVSPTGAKTGVTITFTFDAPRAKVYEAWTDPKHFTHWWGPAGFSSPLAGISLDVKPGGVWRAAIVSDEDGTEIPFAGTYTAVSAPDQLAFTMVDPSEDQASADVTTLVFTEADGKTEMAFNQAGVSEADKDELYAGWSSFFDKLNAYLTKS